MSKPGVSVHTNNPTKLNMHSQYPLFNIVGTFSGTVSATYAGDAVIYEHDLGYVPLVLFYSTIWSGDPNTYVLHTNNNTLIVSQGFLKITSSDIILSDGLEGQKYYGYLLENIQL